MLRTFLLLAALTGLFGLLGFAIAGQAGMVIALGIAAAMNLFAYWNSDQMVLRMYRAKPIEPAQPPRLYHVVRQLAARAEIPTPKAYIIESEQLSGPFASRRRAGSRTMPWSG